MIAFGGVADAALNPETTISSWVDGDSVGYIDEDGNGTEPTKLSYTIQTPMERSTL